MTLYIAWGVVLLIHRQSNCGHRLCTPGTQTKLGCSCQRGLQHHGQLLCAQHDTVAAAVAHT